MILIDSKSLLVHNGHDNENEKICDLWKFDLTSNSWTLLEQKGDIPQVS